MPQLTSVRFAPQSWVSKARFLLEGVVYKYSAGDEKAENFSRIKDVPSKDVVGTLEGCWRKQINYKPKASKVRLASAPLSKSRKG